MGKAIYKWEDKECKFEQLSINNQIGTIYLYDKKKDICVFCHYNEKSYDCFSYKGKCRADILKFIQLASISGNIFQTKEICQGLIDDAYCELKKCS